MTNEQIIEKIQKLLSLATSSNQAEAELAAAKANEMMIKYNLQMQQVESHNADYANEKIDCNRLSMEDKYICPILTTYFFVKAVRSSRSKTITFMGEKNNLENALYVRNFLTETFKRLFKEYKKESGCPQSHKQSFYFGLFQGFTKTLEETKKAAEARYEMVVVEDQGLTDYMNDIFNGGIKSSKARVSLRSRDAMSSGQEAGSKIRVSRAVGGSSSSGKYIG